MTGIATKGASSSYYLIVSPIGLDSFNQSRYTSAVGVPSVEPSVSLGAVYFFSASPIIPIVSSTSGSETTCCGPTRSLIGRAASSWTHSPESFLRGGIIERIIGKGLLFLQSTDNGDPSHSLAYVPVAKFIGVRSKVPESHQFQFGVL
jgi:hypothetical protein